MWNDRFFQIYLSLVDHIVMKKWRKCDELISVLFMIWKFPPCCSTQWWMKKLSLKQKTDNLNWPIWCQHCQLQARHLVSTLSTDNLQSLSQMIQGVSETYEWGFVTCFLKVFLACWAIRAAAVQPNGLGTSRDLYILQNLPRKLPKQTVIP